MARARRGAGLARAARGGRAGVRSAPRSCWQGSPLALARAWLRAARWYHGPICVPAMVRQCCREALALLDQAGAGRGCRSGARRSRRSPGRRRSPAASRRPSDCWWRCTSCRPDTHADDLSIYDVAHARALALMRRGAFVEGYAPAIAAGEAITRAGRPDLAYGCWANAAGAAAAAGDYERALEFIDRAGAALAGKGLVGLELQLLAMRSFVLLRIGRIARRARGGRAEAQARGPARRARSSRRWPRTIAALVALAQGDYARAAELLEQALAREAPISRPLTRLRRAEALARSRPTRRGRGGAARDDARAGAPERLPGDARGADGARAGADRGARRAIASWPSAACSEAAEGWRRQVRDAEPRRQPDGGARRPRQAGRRA